MLRKISLIGLLIVAGCKEASVAEVRTVASPETPPQNVYIDRYFAALESGGDGGEFWCPDQLQKQLFSVKSHKLLKDVPSKMLGEDGHFMVMQVESSTAGGMPIVKNWQVGIHLVEDDYCVSDLIEHHSSK